MEQRPSGVDRLIARIDRAPAPAWVIYLGLFTVLLVALMIPAWIRGGLHPPSVIHIQMAGGMVGPLGLIHYLDRLSVGALRQFRAVCDIDDEEARRLLATLTPMPAIPVAAILLGSISLSWVFALSDTHLMAPLKSSRAELVTGTAALGVGASMVNVLVYHTIRQLRFVSRVHAHVTRLDLFNLTPLYGFANLAARTSMVWAAALYLSVVSTPGALESEFTVTLCGLQGVLMLITFAWPLLGIHQRIREKKHEALGQVGQALNAVIQAVNQRAQSLSLQDAGELNSLIDSLVTSRDVLSKVPTWPWRPGTPVAVLSTVLLPVGLAVAERILVRLFGI